MGTPAHDGPVVVTGGTGHVARHVLARLAASSIPARAVGRDDDPAQALAGAGAVIHLAGALRPRRGDTYDEANAGTVRRMLAALPAGWAGRIAYLSYTGADPASRNAYLRTKGIAEDLILAAGHRSAVVRATFIFGPPEDPGPSAAAFICAGGRPVTMIGSGRQRYAPVHVADVAEALVRLVTDDGAPTGVLSIAGPQIVTADAFTDILNGRAVRHRHIRRPMARIVAAVTPSLRPAMIGILAGDSLPDPAAPSAATSLGLGLHRLTHAYPPAA